MAEQIPAMPERMVFPLQQLPVTSQP